MAWTAGKASGSTTQAALLTQEGVPRVDFTALSNAAFATETLASRGLEMLVVGRDGNRRLVAARVTIWGGTLDPEPLVIDDQSSNAPAAASWTGERWVVAWARDGDMRLRVAEVSLAGVVSEPKLLEFRVELPSNSIPRSFTRLSLATAGGELFLVWSERQDCFTLCVGWLYAAAYVVRLASDGTPSTEPVKVATAHNAVATNGAELAILAATDIIFIPLGDAVLQPEPPRRLVDLPFAVAGDITWDGDEFVVALRQAWRPVGDFLSVHRIAARPFRRSKPAVSIRVNGGTSWADGVARPAIAAMRAEPALVALHENAPADTARVVVYRESEMEPVPAPPAPPASAIWHRTSSYDFEIAWHPAQGEIDGYLVEGRVWNDEWITIRIVPANVTRTGSYLGSYVTEVRVRAFNSGGMSEPVNATRTSRSRAVR